MRWSDVNPNDRCPKCIHPWHGLPCTQRGNNCPCVSSIPTDGQPVEST